MTLSREQIEKIKRAVTPSGKGLLPSPQYPAENITVGEVIALCDMALRSLSPDAQRQSEAVAGRFVNVNDLNGKTPHYQQVAEEYKGTEGTIPLYLHPAERPVSEERIREIAEGVADAFDWETEGAHDDCTRITAQAIRLALSSSGTFAQGVEAAAKVCDDKADSYDTDINYGERLGARACAVAVRALSPQEAQEKL